MRNFKIIKYVQTTVLMEVENITKNMKEVAQCYFYMHCKRKFTLRTHQLPSCRDAHSLAENELVPALFGSLPLIWIPVKK